MATAVGMYKFFVKSNKIEWFFKHLPVSLLAGSIITTKLQEVDPAFNAKEKDNSFAKEIFLIYV